MNKAAQHLYDRALRIAFFSDLHGTRFTLALAEFIWSVTLLMPGETFGRPTYSVMSHVMPEEAWGFMFLIMSATQMHILFSMKYHDRFAVWFAGINACVWGYVVVAMYMSVSPPPAAISGETALAIAASWIYIRSGYIVEGIRSSDAGKGMRTSA